MIFFAEKNVTHFSSKTIYVFENALPTIVNEFVLKKLVQLTMLWTTRPKIGADNCSQLFFRENKAQHFMWIIC